MAYVANQQLQVGRGGEVVTLRVGDPIPEAADWPWQTREHYLRNSRIKEVPDPVLASASARKGKKEEGSNGGE